MNALKNLIWKLPIFNLKMFHQGVLFFDKLTAKSRQLDEDSRRKEYILSFVLLGSIILLVAINISVLYRLFNKPDFQGLLTAIPIILLVVFTGMLILAKKGYGTVSSYLLVSIYFISIAFAAYQWGPDLPTVLLGFALLTVISSVLISTKFSFWMTLIIMTTLLIMVNLENQQVILPDRSWIQKSLRNTDVINYSILLLIITTVSWLSNRETEKSLQRARRSEFELKQERDLLEIKVDQRTRELRQAELQKISELSQFAEFGRLSLGFFHDLINPLNALLLNIRQLKNTPESKLSFASKAINESFDATKRMEEFMLKIRKQLQREESREIFFLDKEINEVLLLLNYKIREAKIRTEFNNRSSIQFYGSPLKFRQLILNLVCNAVESYPPVATGNNRREIIINLQKLKENIKLDIIDFGAGIPNDKMDLIFEPFYTTKQAQGVGIGLSTVKNIVESELKGNVEVKGNNGSGSIFTITWPSQSV